MIPHCSFTINVRYRVHKKNLPLSDFIWKWTDLYKLYLWCQQINPVHFYHVYLGAHGSMFAIYRPLSHLGGDLNSCWLAWQIKSVLCILNEAELLRWKNKNSGTDQCEQKTKQNRKTQAKTVCQDRGNFSHLGDTTDFLVFNLGFLGDVTADHAEY